MAISPTGCVHKETAYFEPGFLPRLCFSKIHLYLPATSFNTDHKTGEGKGDLLSVGTSTSLTLALAVFRADAFHLKMEERTE